jgi:cell division initiation protein
MAEPSQGTGGPPSLTPQSLAARTRRPRAVSAVDRVRQTDFPIGLRGYERAAVDSYVAEVAQLVAELEATQLRETVVQRALDEVGEQTSGILQRAHEAADEITSRSRSLADARLEDAERHAETLRREAEQYAQAVISDARRLWSERQRLIEEIRQFADEVLGVADEALERLPELPMGDASGEAGAATGVEPAPALGSAAAAAYAASPAREDADWGDEDRSDDAGVGPDEQGWREADTTVGEPADETEWEPDSGQPEGTVAHGWASEDEPITEDNDAVVAEDSEAAGWANGGPASEEEPSARTDEPTADEDDSAGWGDAGVAADAEGSSGWSANGGEVAAAPGDEAAAAPGAETEAAAAEGAPTADGSSHAAPPVDEPTREFPRGALDDEAAEGRPDTP